MLQDKHRGLARHPRDFPEHKFVGHQIPQHRNGNLGERLDDLPQPLDFLQMFRHQIIVIAKRAIIARRKVVGGQRSVVSKSFGCYWSLTPDPCSGAFSHERRRRSSITRSVVSTALAASASSILTGITASGVSPARYPPRFTASFSVVTKPSASLRCRSCSKSRTSFSV